MTANEKLKEKILIELYNTGRINGYYFSKTSKSKENPIKGFISKYLAQWYKIYGEHQHYYIEEIYSVLFVELFNKDADLFVEYFADNTVKLHGTCLDIIKYKGFYKLYVNNIHKPILDENGNQLVEILDKPAFDKDKNPKLDKDGNVIYRTKKLYVKDLLNNKNSFMSSQQFASAFNKDDENVINPTEYIEDYAEPSTVNGAILFEEDVDTFHDQYNVSAAEMVAELSPEEKDLFYMLASGRKGRKQVQQRIKDLKEKLNLIKRKLTRTMTEQDLYNTLEPLEPVFEGYKNKTLSALSVDQIEQVKLGYQTMQQVYVGVLPRIFTTSCSSCVISTIEQFIMTYDRLKLTYFVAEPEDTKKVIEDLKTQSNDSVKKKKK